jgi:hypothetical protein
VENMLWPRDMSPKYKQVGECIINTTVSALIVCKP